MSCLWSIFASQNSAVLILWMSCFLFIRHTTLDDTSQVLVVLICDSLYESIWSTVNYPSWGKWGWFLKWSFFSFFFFLGGPTVHSLLSNIIAHCTYGFGTIPWFSLKNRWMPLSWIALILYQPCLSKLIIFKVILMTC